jgi:hypothetical protein
MITAEHAHKLSKATEDRLREEKKQFEYNNPTDEMPYIEIRW